MNPFALINNQDLIRQTCLIDGQWQSANSGKTIEVFNPFNNEKLGEVPDFGADEVHHAIKLAKTAQKSWAKLTAKERSTKLMAWADLIDQNKDDLGKIMTLEQGKPLTESVGEIAYANSFIRYYADECKRITGEVLTANSPHLRHIVLKQPVGVCSAITPWNFPSAMITRKTAPALASGCVMIVKPDSQTPFSALALAYLAQQAGIPDGVLTIITGDAVTVGKVLSQSPDIAKLSFTGSTPVGRLLMKQSADTLKKLSMELGGNAPFIVFDDANVDKAVEQLMIGKFKNAGQMCVSPNRIFVHSSRYDEFCEKLVKKVESLKVGNGLDKDTQIGVLINQKAVQKAQALLDNAVARGAKVLTGGKVADDISPNAFLPTVLSDVDLSMDLACNELFSPIAPIYRFDDEDEVINQANDTEYGLASYFFCQDYARAWRVAESLESGMVGHNTVALSHDVAPFGGVKQSGFGREGSHYGLDEYLTVKSWCVGL